MGFMDNSEKHYAQKLVLPEGVKIVEIVAEPREEMLQNYEDRKAKLANPRVEKHFIFPVIVDGQNFEWDVTEGKLVYADGTPRKSTYSQLFFIIRDKLNGVATGAVLKVTSVGKAPRIQRLIELK